MNKSVLNISKENPIFGDGVGAFDTYQYSPAVRAGGLLFIAGSVGVRSDGLIPDSVEEQSILAFEHIVEILRLEGLTTKDLVEIVSYHVDLEDNLPAFIPIKERFVPAPFPAWTILGIEALGLSQLKIEIRCVAALPI